MKKKFEFEKELQEFVYKKTLDFSPGKMNFDAAWTAMADKVFGYAVTTLSLLMIFVGYFPKFEKLLTLYTKSPDTIINAHSFLALISAHFFKSSDSFFWFSLLLMFFVSGIFLYTSQNFIRPVLKFFTLLWILILADQFLYVIIQTLNSGYVDGSLYISFTIMLCIIFSMCLAAHHLYKKQNFIATKLLLSISLLMTAVNSLIIISVYYMYFTTGFINIPAYAKYATILKILPLMPFTVIILLTYYVLNQVFSAYSVFKSEQEE